MFIKTKVEKLIGYLIIDRPESLNAMNNQVLDELTMMVNELISDSDVRVIIISGAPDIIITLTSESDISSLTIIVNSSRT